MHYTRLRGTDLDVSGIAMGCWGIIGGLTWGKRDDMLGEKTIRTAFDHGINLFDTAPAYGNGDSEKILGKAVSRFKSKVVIASKIGKRFTDTRELITQCENSLQRLDRDYIDLYQVHWHNDSLPSIPDILETLFKFSAINSLPTDFL